MLKKIVSLLMCLVVLGAFVACDGNSAPVVPNINDFNQNNNNTVNNNNNNNNNSTSIPSGGNASTTQNPNPWINICTYNILRCEDNVTGKTTPDNIVNFLSEYKIGIAALQEVDVNNSRSSNRNSPFKDQPKYIAEKLTEKTGEQYYYAFAAGLVGFHGTADSSYENEYGFPNGVALYGNAIISKYPILSTRYVHIAAHTVDPEKPSTQLGEQSRERRVLLIAEIQVEEEVVTVISTHFGLQQDERELALEKIKLELLAIKTPVILMGDLNATVSNSVIQGLHVLLTPTAPGDKPYTMSSSSPHSKIDWIFVSNGMGYRNHRVPNVNYSDHLPVVAEIQLPQSKTKS